MARLLEKPTQSFTGGRLLSSPQGVKDPEQELKKSFFQRVGEDLTKRKENLATRYGEDLTTGMADKGRTTQRVLGQVAGGVSDIVFETIRPVVEPVVGGIVKSVSEGGGLLGEFIKSPLGQNIKTQFSAAKELIDKKKEADPEFAAKIRDLEDTGNIGMAILDAMGIGEAITGTKTGFRTIAKTLEEISEQASKKSVVSSFDDIVEYIAPKLTPTEEAAAKASGRATTEGIMKKTVITPSKRQLEIAKYAEEAGVDISKNTFDENIRLMREAQKTSATELRTGLKESKAIWNQNEVKSSLRSVERPITVKSDPIINKAADNFEKAVLRLAEDNSKKAEGLLDLRQELDELIDLEFPANVYTKDTPLGQYIRKMRQALNDLTESKLPDGLLPNGKSFKGELRRQSLLYDAIENVAEKAPKVGESARPILARFKKFAKKHPWITGGVAALGGERILKKLGVPVP